MTTKQKYTKADFFEDVKNEAVALKKHATNEEIERLDFIQLDPCLITRCIYGLMTGDCTSLRAAELITACCKRYIHNPGHGEFSDNGFIAVKKHVNGEKIPGVENAKDFAGSRFLGIDYLSSIETYILLPEAKNKNLIEFLKGQTDNLIL